jgi:pyruvate,water dikinase
VLAVHAADPAESTNCCQHFVEGLGLLVSLAHAAADSCGGKADALGTLLRAGLPVPDGFVVPFDVFRLVRGDPRLGPDAVRRAIRTRPLPDGLRDALARALDRLGDAPLAVRSSADGEDTAHASAAGQHESVLAVRGLDAVADAVRACWASLYGERAVCYRDATGDDRPPGDPAMAVLVQRLVDADVSGVMFTPARRDDPTRIEASWGLGPSVVGGTVTPDSYRVAADGSLTRTVAHKRTRLDRDGTRLVAREVPAADRDRPSLDHAAAVRLAELGRRAAAVLGEPQDIEWALADDRLWLLQSRPITAPPPPTPTAAAPATLTGTPGSRRIATGTARTPHPPASATPTTLTGTPGSHGTATGTTPTPPPPASATPTTLTGTPGSSGTATGMARIVRGPADFARVRRGDILVCPYTDPAWTPLLRLAAGVVTETGGVLSHAAIVARERRIPAVLGIPDATARISDAAPVTIDGDAGTVTTAHP